MEKRLFINTTGRLAAVVGEERLAYGLSVEELAAKSGVDVQIIAELEAGTPRTNLGAVLRVLDALGVRPYALPPVKPPTAAPIGLDDVMRTYLA